MHKNNNSTAQVQSDLGKGTKSIQFQEKRMGKLEYPGKKKQKTKKLDTDHSKKKDPKEKTVILDKPTWEVLAKVRKVGVDVEHGGDGGVGTEGLVRLPLEDGPLAAAPDRVVVLARWARCPGRYCLCYPRNPLTHVRGPGINTLLSNIVLCWSMQSTHFFFFQGPNTVEFTTIRCLSLSICTRP